MSHCEYAYSERMSSRKQLPGRAQQAMVKVRRPRSHRAGKSDKYGPASVGFCRHRGDLCGNYFRKPRNDTLPEGLKITDGVMFFDQFEERPKFRLPVRVNSHTPNSVLTLNDAP
jgi:hypothetical protein